MCWACSGHFFAGIASTFLLAILRSHQLRSHPVPMTCTSLYTQITQPYRLRFTKTKTQTLRTHSTPKRDFTQRAISPKESFRTFTTPLPKMLDHKWWLENKDNWVECVSCQGTFNHMKRRRGHWLPDGRVQCDECREFRRPVYPKKEFITNQL